MPRRTPYTTKLKGGDRRSIGKSNLIVARVLADPAGFVNLIDGLEADDPLVRIRSADAAEKVSLRHPEWLAPHKKLLLRLAAETNEKELRWHLAQMLPRLDLTQVEQQRAIAHMMDYLSDESRIVQTFALQALVDLAEGDARQTRRVSQIISKASLATSPAVRARARKLLRTLSKD